MSSRRPAQSNGTSRDAASRPRALSGSRRRRCPIRAAGRSVGIGSTGRTRLIVVTDTVLTSCLGIAGDPVKEGTRRSALRSHDTGTGHCRFQRASRPGSASTIRPALWHRCDTNWHRSTCTVAEPPTSPGRTALPARRMARSEDRTQPRPASNTSNAPPWPISSSLHLLSSIMPFVVRTLCQLLACRNIRLIES